MVGLCMGGTALVALAAPASASAASSEVVPATVGIMGAAEAPATEDAGRDVAPMLLQASGVALLLAGGVTVARSWVSPGAAG